MTDEKICGLAKRIASVPAIRTILESISRQTNMRIAAIAFVNSDRWVLTAIHDVIGLDLHPGYALASQTTICHDVCSQVSPVIIDEISSDERYATHRMPLQFGFQSYVSFPIRLHTGDVFGTLLAMDTLPNALDPGQTLEMFSVYADLVAFYLRAKYESEPDFFHGFEDRRDCELRELHVAMLDHDLRNPLSAIANAAGTIAQRTDDKMILDMVQIVQSSGHRMTAMVNNMMGFSRSRIGTCWLPDIQPEASLQEKLEQTISEHLINSRGRIVERDFDLRETVHCDSTMIQQVAANLLSNALTHGHPEQPIRFRAYHQGGNFIISITNSCNQIPESELNRIFQPFAQTGHKEGRRKGLGLGLHIVSEIAAAHQGKVTVDSRERATTFTFIIPDRQDVA